MKSLKPLLVGLFAAVNSLTLLSCAPIVLPAHIDKIYVAPNSQVPGVKSAVETVLQNRGWPVTRSRGSADATMETEISTYEIYRKPTTEYDISAKKMVNVVKPFKRMAGTLKLVDHRDRTLRWSENATAEILADANWTSIENSWANTGLGMSALGGFPQKVYPQ